MQEYSIENYKKWLKANNLQSNYNNLMKFKDELAKDEEHYNEVIQLYDELMQKDQKRGISYGEIAYIQSLSSGELTELYETILKELEGQK